MRRDYQILLNRPP